MALAIIIQKPDEVNMKDVQQKQLEILKDMVT